MGCFYGLDRIASGCDNLRVLSRSFDRNNNFLEKFFGKDILYMTKIIVMKGEITTACNADQSDRKRCTGIKGYFFIGVSK